MKYIKRLLELLTFPEVKALWRWLITPPLQLIGEIEHSQIANRGYFYELEQADAVNRAWSDINADLRTRLADVKNALQRYRREALPGVMFFVDCSNCGQSISEAVTPSMRYPRPGVVQHVCGLCNARIKDMPGERQVREERLIYA